MDTDTLQPLVAQGLQAAKRGGKIASDAAGAIQNDATHPDLKDALREGEQQSKEWQARVDRVMSQVGADGEKENPILKAHYEVAQETRRAAPDADTRDLGIIAAGQLALHYWIAAFGTLGAYLKQMGQSDAAQTMSRCVDEARKADEQHTQLAQQIMAG